MPDNKGHKKDFVFTECKGHCYDQSTCIVFYCIPFNPVLFYEHIKDTNKALLRKAVLQTSCKHRQKFEINCVLS